MKVRLTVDMAKLERLVAAGASGAVLLEELKSREGRSAPRPKRQGRTRQDKAQLGTTNHNKAPQGTASEIAERELYVLGKQMFGPRAGGLISRLRQHHGYDDTEARKALEIAATKSDPREYLLGSMRTKGNGARNPTMAAFDDLLARVEGGAGESDHPMRDITPRGD